MNIGNITSNNFNLNGVGKDIQIEVYEQLIGQLQQENKQLKEELQKADSITQSCIFEGKEESTISFRECLNKLELYKEVIDEVREYTKKEIREYKYAIDETTMDSDTEDIYDMVIRNFEKLLQILDKAKD